MDNQAKDCESLSTMDETTIEMNEEKSSPEKQFLVPTLPESHRSRNGVSDSKSKELGASRCGSRGGRMDEAFGTDHFLLK